MRTHLTILLVLAATFCYAQREKDSAAIVKLLEKESATWRSGDTAAHAACWHLQPYSKILVSTADGRTMDIPPSAIVHPPANSSGSGGTSSNSNYVMSIFPGNAWVSHDEISISKDGNKSYSHEIRMLEKINGEWKLVAQSLHLYKP